MCVCVCVYVNIRQRGVSTGSVTEGAAQVTGSPQQDTSDSGRLLPISGLYRIAGRKAKIPRPRAAHYRGRKHRGGCVVIKRERAGAAATVYGILLVLVLPE